MDLPKETFESSAFLEHAAEFITSMIQAFLRTGYYLPEHPESKKAKVGLYHKFLNLTHLSGEITFLYREEERNQNIIIEGFGEKSLRLTDLMFVGMAETYNPRFVRFLERKEMISLSLKSRMEEEEFSKFIDLMSEPSLEDMREHAVKEKFVAHLKEKGIQNISFIFNEDMITARRNIPWRAALALSRLKKDLKIIPLFRNMNLKELGQIRQQVLAEILKPLTSPALVYAFLMNLDLASTEEHTEEDGENEVFSILKEEMILRLAPMIIQDACGQTKHYRDILSDEKFSRIVTKLSATLHSLNCPDSKSFLEEMYRTGLTSMDNLPEEVKANVLNMKLAMNFIEGMDRHLANFEKTADPKDYSQRAQAMVKIIPSLFDLEKYEEAVRIVQALADHRDEESPRATIARDSMAAMAKSGVIDLAADLFLHASKEVRTVLGGLFSMMKLWAAPHLLRIIRETDDSWRKKQAAEILRDFGPEVMAPLIDELNQKQVPVEAKGTILRVLGRVTDRALKSKVIDVILQKVDDPEPHLRSEAIRSLSRLSPRGRFDLFQKKMMDPDWQVKKNAVRGLGLTGDLQALYLLTGIIKQAEKSGHEQDWELATTSVEALGYLFESCPDAREFISSHLISLAESWYPEGRLKRLLRGSHQLPGYSLPNLADALGFIGDDKSQAILSRMAKDKDSFISRKAQDVLKRMKAS